MASHLEPVPILGAKQLCRLTDLLLFGLDDTASFFRVFHGPQVAIVSLLDDTLIHQVGELSFKLGVVDLLLLL